MGGLVVPAIFERLPIFELEVMYGELDGTFSKPPSGSLATGESARSSSTRLLVDSMSVWPLMVMPIECFWWMKWAVDCLEAPRLRCWHRRFVEETGFNHSL